eukprot:TRINITY_DN3761_c0_g1_i1.p1 TRINITY_DN3761_c0_g1~~TRINITY_DN3761_c0_g1_i1.p1  ORF type:complete len:394 (-),score=93.41 TRINITY_DN3761_c0_g1_i1:170-1351(-)
MKELSQLKHPNLLSLHKILRAGNEVLLVVDFIEFGSVERLVTSYGPLNENVISKYAFHALTGLSYLHTNDIMHGAIKPSNLTVRVDGTVQLADSNLNLTLLNTFGDEESGDTFFKNFLVANYPWVSPEVIQRDPWKSSDIWSLGAVVIFMYTGKIPMHEMSAEEVLNIVSEGKHPPLPPTLSQDLQNYLKQSFEKDPEKREETEYFLGQPFIQQRLVLDLIPDSENASEPQTTDPVEELEKEVEEPLKWMQSAIRIGDTEGARRLRKFIENKSTKVREIYSGKNQIPRVLEAIEKAFIDFDTGIHNLQMRDDIDRIGTHDDLGSLSPHDEEEIEEEVTEEPQYPLYEQVVYSDDEEEEEQDEHEDEPEPDEDEDDEDADNFANQKAFHDKDWR